MQNSRSRDESPDRFEGTLMGLTDEITVPSRLSTVASGTKIVVIETDAVSRGNPGPSAVGAQVHLVGSDDHHSLLLVGESIGHVTAPMAKWRAVELGVTVADQLVESSVSKCALTDLDQISHQFIGAMDYHPKFRDPLSAVRAVPSTHVYSVDRDWGLTREADKIANVVLDTGKSHLAKIGNT